MRYLTSDLLGTIISTIGAIIVAIIAKKGAEAVRKNQKGESKNEAPTKPRIYLEWIVIGVVAAIAFVVFNLAWSAFSPRPTVTITSPMNNQGITIDLADTGAGSFVLQGNSSRVIGEPSLRVYVLIHPADPFAGGWWIQPAVVMNADGTWSGQAWIGDPDHSPEAGNLVDVVAVVSDSEQAKSIFKVDDPKDLNPVAQSDVVRFTVSSVQ